MWGAVSPANFELLFPRLWASSDHLLSLCLLSTLPSVPYVYRHFRIPLELSFPVPNTLLVPLRRHGVPTPQTLLHIYRRRHSLSRVTGNIECVSYPAESLGIRSTQSPTELSQSPAPLLNDVPCPVAYHMRLRNKHVSAAI